MARQRKAKPRAVGAPPAIKLTAFHERMGDRFSFSRFYWETAGKDRESMLDRFAAKLRPPTGAIGGAMASAVHPLLPRNAPQDYMDLDFLVRHYEANLPPQETIAYAQLTMRFPDAANLHHPLETVRDWVQDYYCEEGLPAVAILHNPALVGCENPGHVHVMVLARRLNRLGWAGMARDIANDASRAAAWVAWEERWASAAECW